MKDKDFEMAGKTSLNQVKEGEECKLLDINAGKGLEHKLLGMGIIVGTKLKVIRNTGVGALVVGVKNGRVAIGFGMSSKMIVEKV